MRKKSLVLGCLIVVGMFFGTSYVDAEESVENSSSPIPFSILRGAPAKREAVVQSGQKIRILVGSLRTNEFVSKYAIKFKAESEDKESFLLEELYDHGYSWQVASRKFFYTNSPVTVNTNILDETIKGWTSGNRIFDLYNYSAQPLKITFSVNSSIHPRDLPCVDYSDIDFDL